MSLTHRIRSLRDSIAVRVSFQHLYGPAKVFLSDDAFAVVTLVRDAEWFLPAFLEHHLALGAAHIVIVDNGSVDRTVEVAQSFSCVTVIRNPLPARQHEVRLRSMAARRTLQGGWVMFADADEMVDIPFKAGPHHLLAYCNSQGFTAVIGQMLDLYSPESALVTDYKQAVSRSTYYSLELLDKISYHDPDKIKFKWFLKDNVCIDPGVKLLQGGLRREVFGENPFLSKHTFVRNLPRIALMTHPHCASGVRVADITVLLRHYKLAGDWLARDRASVAAASWHHGEDAQRLSAASKVGFTLNPASPLIWQGTATLVDKEFLYASQRARGVLMSACE